MQLTWKAIVYAGFENAPGVLILITYFSMLWSMAYVRCVAFAQEKDLQWRNSSGEKKDISLL